MLPEGAASSRIGGPFGSAHVDKEPEQSFAVLTALDDGKATVSQCSAPRGRVSGSAAHIATQFPGGGRAAAAGIDALAEVDVAPFMDVFETTFALSLRD